MSPSGTVDTSLAYRDRNVGLYFYFNISNYTSLLIKELIFEYQVPEFLASAISVAWTSNTAKTKIPDFYSDKRSLPHICLLTNKV